MVTLKTTIGEKINGNNSWKIEFSELPDSVAKLKELPVDTIKSPENVVALVICALAVYPRNKDESIAMLDYLNGPSEISTYNKQFLADRFRGVDYIPKSYFVGATPDNNYEPSAPYTIVVMDNPYSKAQLSEGYLKLFVQSGGADSPREVVLRTKASTGEWFLWEQMLLSGIREPKANDPWA